MCVTKWLRNEKKIQSKKNVKYQNIYLYAWKGNHYWNNQIKSGFYFVSYQWIVCKIVFSRYVRCISLLLLGDAATFTKSLFKTKKDTKKKHNRMTKCLPMIDQLKIDCSRRLMFKHISGNRDSIYTSLLLVVKRNTTLVPYSMFVVNDSGIDSFGINR